jgi:hypothetical protein
MAVKRPRTLARLQPAKKRLDRHAGHAFSLSQHRAGEEA